MNNNSILRIAKTAAKLVVAATLALISIMSEPAILYNKDHFDVITD